MSKWPNRAIPPIGTYRQNRSEGDARQVRRPPDVPSAGSASCRAIAPSRPSGSSPAPGGRGAPVDGPEGPGRVATSALVAVIIPPDVDPTERLKLAAACVGSGVLLCLSLPPFGFWPLALAGLVGLDRLIADQPAKVRFRRGWLVAMGCFVPSLVWMTALTAPGYVIACAAYSGMLGAGIAAAPPGRGRWLALAGTWVLAELLRWTWPFGGVPLANLAIGQVSGPLAPVLRVGGALLLVLVAVLAGQAVAAAVRRAWWYAGGIAVGVVVIVAGSMAAPSGHAVGTAEIALVQGGGEQGTRKTDDRRDRGVRAAPRRHRARRDPRRPRGVARGRDRHRRGVRRRPLGGPRRRARPQELDAPMIVGTVEGRGAERVPEQRGARRRRPARSSIATTRCTGCPSASSCRSASLLEPVAGDALPDRDALIGDLPAHLDVPEPVGRVATPISWEIFFADRTREGVEDGARLVLNPTNGASFTGTIVQTQQVALVADARHRERPVGRPGRTDRLHRDHRRRRRRARAHRRQRAGGHPARGGAARGPHDLHALGQHDRPGPGRGPHRSPAGCSRRGRPNGVTRGWGWHPLRFGWFLPWRRAPPRGTLTAWKTSRHAVDIPTEPKTPPRHHAGHARVRSWRRRARS